MKTNFISAITMSQMYALKKNTKFCIIGIEVSYDKLGFKKKFPNQVFEMPVSESSINGFAVGLASQGYKPLVHHGRVEFAMLGFDQIFTQASKWDYMFGGSYPCPVSFKISLGRREGDGPQHTEGYHSLFLQSNLDIYIPSTPQEAYDQIIEISQSKNPSVFLEHRRLFLVEQSVNKRSINKSSFKIYKKNNNKNILIVTYGDGLVDCLMAKDFLSVMGVELSVMSIIKFLSINKNNLRMLKKISDYKKIIFFDTRPFNFGPLNSILGLLTKNLKQSQFEIHTISPQDTPAPSSHLLMEKYYPTKKDIINLVLNILGKKQKIKINLEKDYMHGFPKLDLDKF
tara:strand:+ start:2085 stop:3110 length:1026 start_codon:yes stop_codon:yes gene_type:complete